MDDVSFFPKPLAALLEEAIHPKIKQHMGSP
jgi:hypothetical protein